MAREWYAKRYKTRNKYAESVPSRLVRDVFPEIGGMRIGAVEAPAILVALRKAEARGVHDVVGRLLWSVEQIFTYGIASGRAVRNPALGLKPALEARPKPKHMARVEVGEVPKLLDDIRCYMGREQTRLAPPQIPARRLLVRRPDQTAGLVAATPAPPQIPGHPSSP